MLRLSITGGGLKASGATLNGERFSEEQILAIYTLTSQRYGSFENRALALVERRGRLATVEFPSRGGGLVNIGKSLAYNLGFEEADEPLPQINGNLRTFYNPRIITRIPGCEAAGVLDDGAYRGFAVLRSVWQKQNSPQLAFDVYQDKLDYYNETRWSRTAGNILARVGRSANYGCKQALSVFLLTPDGQRPDITRMSWRSIWQSRPRLAC